MRRGLVLTSTATTLLVLAAFLVPLALVIRTSVATNATNTAAVAAQTLASVVGTVSRTSLDLAVQQEQGRAGGRAQIAVILGDDTRFGTAVARPEDLARARAGEAFTVDVPEGRDVYVSVGGRPEGTAAVLVHVPQAELTQGVVRAWVLLGLLGVALLVVAALVADRLGRSLVRSVDNLAATATALGGGDLSARADSSGPPEVRAVGSALNRLGTRIGELLAAEREHVADLSHRLRTPATALRLDAESLSDADERARLSGDVDDLQRMVDEVIREARRPVREGVVARCDAGEVVSSRAAFWAVLAEDQGRPMHVSIDSGPLLVRVSSDDLAGAVDALMDNVFAHTPDGAGFSLTVARDGTTIRVVVSDDGPGLDPDASVGRGSSGRGSTGLGLDIARRTAEASGGFLEVHAGTGRGAEVVLNLGAPGD